jgi:hypothetical protein
MADIISLSTKKNLKNKNNKKNIISEKQKIDVLIDIWNKKITNIEFVSVKNNNNNEIEIILHFKKTNKQILVFCIKMIEYGEIIYDYKNNFSKSFLNKIFSLKQDIGYSILNFYYTLLDYIKNQKMPKFDIYEYIYFVLNTKIDSIDFFNRDIQLILNDIFKKNIISRKNFEINESSFNSYYSYDYYIDTYLKISKNSKNTRNNKQILKNEFFTDFNRNSSEYFFYNNNTEISSNIESKKSFLKQFLNSEKYKKSDIYIKIIQSLYQVIFGKCTAYLYHIFRIYSDSLFSFNGSCGKSWTVKKNGDNIIIEAVCNICCGIVIDENRPINLSLNVIDKNPPLNLSLNVIDKNPPTKIFLNVINRIEIDILNNTLKETNSFKWTNTKIREAIRLWNKIGINGLISHSVLEKIYKQSSVTYLLEEINKKKQPINHKKIVIINLNENGNQYTHNDCFEYLCNIIVKDPLFILVSTQDSTTRLVKGESVSFQHILKEGLEILGYTYTIKENIIKSYSYKSGFSRNVYRMRLYKKNSVENKNIMNVDINKKNSSLVVKLNYSNKYLFLNINFSESNSEEEKFKYFFRLITQDIKIFDYEKNIMKIKIIKNTTNMSNENKNLSKEINKGLGKIINNEVDERLKKGYNLIDLYINSYYIYFLSSINIKFLSNPKYRISSNLEIMKNSKETYARESIINSLNNNNNNNNNNESINKRHLGNNFNIISSINISPGRKKSEKNPNNKISDGKGKNFINMKTMKNNNTLLSKLIDNYLEKKLVFNESRPILSFTQTQKNKIKEYDNKIKIFKDGYRNQIYGFFSSLQNCGGNEMSLFTGLNKDVEII